MSKVTINGYEYTEAELLEFLGVNGSPSVSILGKSKIYFDSTIGKLQVSENGNTYQDLVVNPIGTSTSGEVLWNNSGAVDGLGSWDGYTLTVNNLFSNDSVFTTNGISNASNQIINAIYRQLIASDGMTVSATWDTGGISFANGFGLGWPSVGSHAYIDANGNVIEMGNVDSINMNSLLIPNSGIQIPNSSGGIYNPFASSPWSINTDGTMGDYSGLKSFDMTGRALYASNGDYQFGWATPENLTLFSGAGSIVTTGSAGGDFTFNVNSGSLTLSPSTHINTNAPVGIGTIPNYSLDVLGYSGSYLATAHFNYNSSYTHTYMSVYNGSGMDGINTQNVGYGDVGGRFTGTSGEWTTLADNGYSIKSVGQISLDNAIITTNSGSEAVDLGGDVFINSYGSSVGNLIMSPTAGIIYTDNIYDRTNTAKSIDPYHRIGYANDGTTAKIDYSGNQNTSSYGIASFYNASGIDYLSFGGYFEGWGLYSPDHGSYLDFWLHSGDLFFYNQGGNYIHVSDYGATTNQAMTLNAQGGLNVIGGIVDNSLVASIDNNTRQATANDGSTLQIDWSGPYALNLYGDVFINPGALGSPGNVILPAATGVVWTDNLYDRTNGYFSIDTLNRYFYDTDGITAVAQYGLGTGLFQVNSDLGFGSTFQSALTSGDWATAVPVSLVEALNRVSALLNTLNAAPIP